MITSDLAVVIPSRGRPEQCAKLVARISATTIDWVRCIVVIDEDDPVRSWYHDMMIAATPGVTILTIPHAGHVAAINAGAAHALTMGRQPVAIAKFDDDHWPVTHSWDRRMLGVLNAMGGGVVYGDDLLQGRRLPTAPAISTSVIDALGWMGPPVLWHMFVDDFWRDLGMAVGRLRYLPRVVVEHRHPTAGKAALDAGYERVGTQERFDIDKATYRAFVADPDGMGAAVRAVTESIGRGGLRSRVAAWIAERLGRLV